MFLLNGNPLPLDQAFTVGEGDDAVQYPANWLRLASPEEKAALGITDAPQPEYYDDRFYWGPNNPKDLDTLKTTWISQINQIAYSLLFPTDWMVVRKSEVGTEIPAATVTYRAEIRTAAAANRTAITNAADIGAFVSVATALNWPIVDMISSTPTHGPASPSEPVMINLDVAPTTP
jgi:hypothetical protein